MIDQVRRALADYDTDAAPAHAILDRAERRLRATIAELLGQPLDADPRLVGLYASSADPEEPDALDRLVDAIDSPGEVQQPPESTQASPASPVPATAEGSPLPASQPGQEHGVPVSAPPARAPLGKCPDCPRTFAGEQGLRIHRGRQHPEAALSASKALQKRTAAARETFLCSRCDATFHTRQGRDIHQVQHPAVPDPAPTGGERIQRRPPTRSAAYVAGGNGVAVGVGE